MGPTPERLAKGDLEIRTAGAFHRSVPPVERLRDQDKLDSMPRVNQAMFEAAEKLKRHFDGLGTSIKAQDLNKVIGASSEGNLEGEEAWVHHHDAFKKAGKLMGWSETNPHRGAARITIAVVCHEMTITDAAKAHLPGADTTAMKAVALDRVREGLWALAAHWRMI